MRALTLLLAGLVLVSRAQAEELAGVVLDMNGNAAASATVSAAALFHSPPLRFVTTSDARGHFRLELPRSLATRGMRWRFAGSDRARM